MASIRGKNSKPELAVRSIAHRLGLRFRLHRKDVPGTPDLVFPRHHAVVLVNGCFWHWHRHRCRRGSMPTTRIGYWTKKLEGNVARDKRVRASLRRQGWRVLTIWECELRKPEGIRDRMKTFFDL
jgi:DNA mismatch endonuclease (patch repair protein)